MDSSSGQCFSPNCPDSLVVFWLSKGTLCWDIYPSDCSMFPIINEPLKGTRFQTVKALKAVTDIMHMI